jgi:hypothetical protein
LSGGVKDEPAVIYDIFLRGQRTVKRLRGRWGRQGFGRSVGQFPATRPRDHVAVNRSLRFDDRSSKSDTLRAISVLDLRFLTSWPSPAQF